MSWRGAALALFACLATFAGGLGVGLAVRAAEPPASLAGPTPPSALPATQREFGDSRTVNVTIERGKETALPSPATGRITAVAELGTTLTSGQRVADVDGGAIVALATALPLWRDLPSDARGTDVEALQAELARLGWDVEVTGRMNSATRRAAAEAVGSYDPNGTLWETIPVARWLWLPAEEVQVARLTVTPGDVVAAGDHLLILPGAAPTARIAPMPPDAFPGAREVLIDGTAFPVDAEGRLTQPEVAMETPAFRNAAQQGSPGEPVSLRAPWRLVQPVTVFAVAPQALYELRGDEGCVQVDGSALPVRLLSSELGQSLITSGTPLTSVDADPSAPCPSR